jgi:hypothetical protein
MIVSSTRALEGIVEAFAALADPPDAAGRDPGHQCIVGHILCDHGSGSNECRTSDSVTTNHRTIGTKGGTFFDKRFGIDTMTRKMCARCGDIGKYTTRTAEYIVLYLNPLVHGHIVLDADTIADYYIITHIDILAKRTTLANTRTALDMAEVPNLGIVAYDDIVVDIATFVNKW